MLLCVVFFFFSLSFGYSSGLSLELEDFIPKCTCYLCTSVTNVTKLSIRPYVVNAVLHCPHPPSGLRPTERSLWELLSTERSCLAYGNTLIGGSSHPIPERPGPLASTGDKAYESFQLHMDQLEPLPKLDHSSFSVRPFLLLSFSLPGVFQRAVLGTVICLTSVSWGTCLR